MTYARTNSCSRRLAAAVLGLAAIILSPLGAVAESTSLTLQGIEAYNNGDYDTAVRALKAAADRGDSDAQVNLGYMYARGQSVRTDQFEAMRLYRLSADQGNSEGMNAVAYKYAFGTGVPVDVSMAVRWFCRAIAAGNPRAMNNLANLHAKGDVLSYDLDEARDLWRQAADLGHTNAMLNLGLSMIQFPEPKHGESEGNHWILHAAELGQPGAIQWLRAAGYQGSLPGPRDEAAMMILAPKKASGHAPECVTS